MVVINSQTKKKTNGYMKISISDNEIVFITGQV